MRLFLSVLIFLFVFVQIPNVFAQQTDNLNLNGTLTIKQAEETGGGIDPLELFLSIIIGGSVVAGTYEWIRQYLTRRREEFVDMSKKKMDVIEKSAPLLTQLGTYSYAISSQLQLQPSQRDPDVCLYHFCNFLYIHNSIFTKFGGLQLGSLAAENIIVDFTDFVLFSLKQGMDYESIHRMRTMTNGTPNFYLFKKSVLPFHPDLKDRFSKWLETIRPADDDVLTPCLAKKTLWLNQLIDIEINHIYSLWYNREPDAIYQIEETGLKDFLIKNKEYHDYLDRIGSMESRRLGKIRNTR